MLHGVFCMMGVYISFQHVHRGVKRLGQNNIPLKLGKLMKLRTNRKHSAVV